MRVGLAEVDVIIDAQFGSTGKGKLAYYMAKRGAYDGVVCDFTPAAGHTAVDGHNTYQLHALPIGAATNVPLVAIGPGGGFTLEALRKELSLLEVESRLCIHPNAMVIQDIHRDMECGASRAGDSVSTRHIASTMTGGGAALAEKVRRGPNPRGIGETVCLAHDVPVLDTYVKRWDLWQELMQTEGARILVETAQGYCLSMDSRWYPHTTCRNINVGECLSRCGPIPIQSVRKVIACYRTFPIRVGNVYDSEGQILGASGSVYDDQEEITFESLAIPVELTSTTKRVRRIFTWSWKNLSESLVALRPTDVFLNFANYAWPGLEGSSGRNIPCEEMWRNLEGRATINDEVVSPHFAAALELALGQVDAKLTYVGTGADDAHMLEMV